MAIRPTRIQPFERRPVGPDEYPSRKVIAFPLQNTTLLSLAHYPSLSPFESSSNTFFLVLVHHPVAGKGALSVISLSLSFIQRNRIPTAATASRPGHLPGPQSSRRSSHPYLRD
ncbi:hypothetical protein Pst134EB_014460 [Puccinia striiformis f. sp. tritici]|nr:hypothetical protein Pst134EB_014460 [Puccinia striiformis f. sp. tritici]